MPSIVPLIALLSLDVTRVLVSLGFGLGFDTDAAALTASGASRFTATVQPSTGLPYPALPIIAASNTTPIVVTTAYPHGVSARGVGGMSCIIAGVLGNLAANNLDVDPRSRTVGLPAGIVAVPTGPTTLALYGQDMNAASSTYSALVPIAGSGVYAGGGTIVPALTDGSILIGSENAKEHSAAPRIVAIPIGAKWGPKSNALVTGARNAERQAQIHQRSVKTRINVIEFHCWGESTPPDPAKNFTMAEALADALEDSAALLYGQPHDISDAVWNDQKARATCFVKSGHLFTFTMTLRTPVLDNPLPFVPSGASFSTVVQSPTPEIAATFSGPTITPS